MVRSNEKSCVCNVFATPHSKNPVKSNVLSYANDNFCSQSDNRLGRENAYKTSETLCFWGFSLLWNRNFSKSVFGFAGDDIEILFFQMDVFFLEIQKFADSATIVEKHQNNLIIWIIFHCPYSFDFFFTELVPVMFVWGMCHLHVSL